MNDNAALFQTARQCAVNVALQIAKNDVSLFNRIVFPVETQLRDLLVMSKQLTDAIAFERMQLLAALSKTTHAWLEEHPNDPACRLLVIKLPSGLVTWDVIPSEFPYFEHLMLSDSQSYDGASIPEKYARLAELDRVAVTIPIPRAEN